MTDTRTKVSIIIAAYNAQELISRCIQSCLNQTYPIFEVIVINDGSQDDTKVILENFVRQDDRVQCYHIENGGQGRARNIALGHARGDYITVLDADDTLHECALERLVASADQHQSDIVVGEWITIDEKKRAKRYAPVFKGIDCGVISPQEKSHIIQNTYFSVAKLYARDMLNKHNIRYGEGYIYEDMEFLIGAVLHAKTISIVSQPLYFVYAGDESSTKVNTDGNWHAESFTKAVRATTLKYGDKLKPFSKYYSHYILRRVYFYTADRHRIPKRSWRHFTDSIFSLLDTLVDGDIEVSTVSKKHLVPFKVWKRNRIAGYYIFQTLNKALGLRKSSQTYRVAKNTYRYIKSSKLMASLARSSLRFQKKKIMKKAESEGFDNNAIFIHGFDSALKGNTKYVIPSLLEYGFHLVTHLQDKNLPNHPNLTRVDRWSLQHHYWHRKCRFHLLETWREKGVGKQEESVWIQLWHGTPFKRMLFDSDEKYVMSNAPMHKVNKMRDITGWDYLIAQNEFSRDKLASSFSFNRNNIVTTHYPRTDIFADENGNEYKSAIREKYNVPANKKLLLYATTWRDYNQYTPNKDFSYQLDLRHLGQLMGDYYVISCLHPFGKDFAPAGAVTTNDDDFQHLMIAADAMVTDYSSAAFDYLLLNKPLCFFTKDLEKFSESRGVYSEILSDFTSMIAFTEEEVAHIIQNWPGLSAIRNKDRYILDQPLTGADNVAALISDLRDNIVQQ